MRKFSTTYSAWIHLLLATTLVVNGAPVIHADDAAAPNPMPPTGAGPSQLPSSFSSMDLNPMASGLNAMTCGSAVGSALNTVSNVTNSLANSGAGGAFNSTGGLFGAGAAALGAAMGNCDGAEDVQSGSSSGGGGSCIAAAASAAAQAIQISRVISTIQCKQNKLQQTADQVNCLMQKAEQLNRQVASIQDMFVNNMQRYQRDVSSLKQTIIDVKNQRRDVDTLLNGNHDDQETPDTMHNGGDVKTHNNAGATTPGINKMRQLFMDFLVGGDTVMGSSNGGGQQGSPNGGTPGQSQCGSSGTLSCYTVELENMNKELVSAKDQLEADVQADVTSGAMDCFNTQVNPSFRCAPNGPPVSARAYMSCRYQQNQQLGKNSVIDMSASKRADATSAQQGLDAIFADIDQQGPKKLANPSKVPGGSPNDPNASQDAVTSADSQTSQYATTPDIIKAYQGRISAMNGNGIDLGGFFAKTLNYCDAQSQNRVAALRKRAGSRYEVRQRTIQKNESLITTMFNTTVNKSAKLWADGIRSMSGQNAPLDTSACNKSSLDVKLNCLKDLQTNLNGLLDGTSPASSMNESIKGTANAPSINFTCKGLNGCATALNNLNTNLKDKSRQVESFKTQYVQMANQSVIQFVQAAGRALAPASAYLNDQLTALNGALSKLGAKRLTVKSLEAEKYSVDQSLDGLYNIPTSAIKLIGGMGRMNPPLPDMTGEGMQAGLEGITERSKELSQKLSQAQQAMTASAQSVASCKDQDKKEVANDANGAASELTRGNCAYSKACNKYKDQLGQTIADLNGVDNKVLGRARNRLSIAGDCQSSDNLTGQLPNENLCESAYQDAISAGDKAAGGSSTPSDSGTNANGM